MELVIVWVLLFKLPVTFHLVGSNSDGLCPHRHFHYELQDGGSSNSITPATRVCCASSVGKNYVPSGRTSWPPSGGALAGKTRKVLNSLPSGLSLPRDALGTVLWLPVGTDKVYLGCISFLLMPGQSASNPGASNGRSASSPRSAGQKSGWGSLG